MSIVSDDFNNNPVWKADYGLPNGINSAHVFTQMIRAGTVYDIGLSVLDHKSVFSTVITIDYLFTIF